MKYWVRPKNEFTTLSYPWTRLRSRSASESVFCTCFWNNIPWRLCQDLLEMNWLTSVWSVFYPGCNSKTDGFHEWNPGFSLHMQLLMHVCFDGNFPIRETCKVTSPYLLFQYHWSSADLFHKWFLWWCTGSQCPVGICSTAALGLVSAEKTKSGEKSNKKEEDKVL